MDVGRVHNVVERAAEQLRAMLDVLIKINVDVGERRTVAGADRKQPSPIGCQGRLQPLVKVIGVTVAEQCNLRTSIGRGHDT